MKKILLTITFISLFFINIINITNAANDKIEFSVFTRSNCIHCIELKKFIETNSTSFSWVSAKYYNIDEKENYKLFEVFTKKYNIAKVTPIILIWDEIIEWYQSEDTTWISITERIQKLNKSSYFENFTWQAERIFAVNWTCNWVSECNVVNDTKLLVKIPFYWVINLKDYSLLFLATILWFVDWFNPCAMWVLVMFLSILAQTWKRKKMFQVAWVFVLAEAIMYFMILNVWYKTWDFIKLDNTVNPIIWLISAWAWAFFIYEFFTKKDWECSIISLSQKKKTIDKIKYIAAKPMTIWVFFATIMIAFSVNIVEFACSIWIPQAFTKLLEMSSLWFIEKQFYVLVYTLFYMVDDFVIFWIAVYAISYLNKTTKYTRYCLLLGWIIMVILWYLFLFNPALLKMIIA